jgi:hypothetical protein
MEDSSGEKRQSVFNRLTPLWPAGHLPLKGGDHPVARLPPISSVAEQMGRLKPLISPLEGEMAGRPEGGADLQHGSALHHQLARDVGEAFRRA